MWETGVFIATIRIRNQNAPTEVLTSLCKAGMLMGADVAGSSVGLGGRTEAWTRAWPGVMVSGL